MRRRYKNVWRAPQSEQSTSLRVWWSASSRSEKHVLTAWLSWSIWPTAPPIQVFTWLMFCKLSPQSSNTLKSIPQMLHGYWLTCSLMHHRLQCSLICRRIDSCRKLVNICLVTCLTLALRQDNLCRNSVTRAFSSKSYSMTLKKSSIKYSHSSTRRLGKIKHFCLWGMLSRKVYRLSCPMTWWIMYSNRRRRWMV